VTEQPHAEPPQGWRPIGPVEVEVDWFPIGSPRGVEGKLRAWEILRGHRPRLVEGDGYVAPAS
jgi:hypothetical protein